MQIKNVKSHSDQYSGSEGLLLPISPFLCTCLLHSIHVLPSVSVERRSSFPWDMTLNKLFSRCCSLLSCSTTVPHDSVITKNYKQASGQFIMFISTRSKLRVQKNSWLYGYEKGLRFRGFCKEVLENFRQFRQQKLVSK